MSSNYYPVHGAGLGLRRSLMNSIADQTTQPVISGKLHRRTGLVWADATEKFL